jgi:hypothetical protein
MRALFAQVSILQVDRYGAVQSLTVKTKAIFYPAHHRGDLLSVASNCYAGSAQEGN